MVVSLKKHFATEKKGLEFCIHQKYPREKDRVEKLLIKIKHIINIDQNTKICEIGSAQGCFIIAWKELGYFCEGLEPNENAIKVSNILSHKMNIKINIKQGFAESIPYDNNSFDLVIALSVMEHVKDVEIAMNEIYRILKPNGAFYFSTTNSLCPKQDEIRFFPFFSWYPDKIKIKVMNYACKYKPSLVGFTDAPAINWFTPWKTKRLLTKVGFEKNYDQWDLKPLNNNISFCKKIILKIIKSNNIMKIIADFFKCGSAYIAIKK